MYVLCIVFCNHFTLNIVSNIQVICVCYSYCVYVCNHPIITISYYIFYSLVSGKRITFSAEQILRPILDWTSNVTVPFNCLTIIS